MVQVISSKSERNKSWFKPWFNILLHTQSIVCHSMRSMFRVLGIYNFDYSLKTSHFLIYASVFFLDINEIWQWIKSYLDSNCLMFYFHNGLHRKFFLHVISNHTQQKAGNGVEFLLILYSHHNQSWYATCFTYCPVSTYMKHEEKKCWNYLHF